MTNKDKALKEAKELARIYREQFSAYTDEDFDGITAQQFMVCVEYSIDMVISAIGNANITNGNGFNANKYASDLFQKTPLCNQEEAEKYWNLECTKAFN